MEEENYSDKKARRLIRHYEAELDKKLANGEISQEDAWDSYFGLLHECDLRWLWEDRDRIIKKIDTTHYNPFLSKRPEIVEIAKIRLAG